MDEPIQPQIGLKPLIKSDSRKILVAGDVLGRFTKFYKRLQVVNEKAGPFDYVLCVGNFFSIDDLNSEDPNLVYIAKDFKDQVKMPIYVLGPCFESQRRFYKPLFDCDLRGTPSFDNGFDIALNVNYLGKKGVLTTTDDFKIAYLSGYESIRSTDYTFNEADIEVLIETCTISRVDILMTTNYPFNIDAHSFAVKTEYLKNLCENGSMLVSKLAKSVLPRYHFAPSEEQFFEREPYRNHLIMQEQPKLVTRFISIASVDNSKKQKWLYAFNITPSKLLSKDEINKQPDDATENPYICVDFDMSKVKRESDILDNGSFFFQQPAKERNNQRNVNYQGGSGYNFNNNPHQSNKRSPSSNDSSVNGEDKRLKASENTCWFCLSSPDVEKHLIISIGDHAYLALAKGGLNDCHFLILPIGHYRSMCEIEIDPEKKNTLNEIGQFKNAIIDFFGSKEQVPVFFERNFKSGHLQLQCVAIPQNKIDNVRDVLEQQCRRNNLKLYELPKGSKMSEQLSEKVPYFYIEFHGERYYIGIKPARGFPMQFGRELLVDKDILDCVAKVDWRNCELNECEINVLVKRTREDFKAYDFTLND